MSNLVVVDGVQYCVTPYSSNETNAYVSVANDVGLCVALIDKDLCLCRWCL
jgi:hypothetical protein